MAVSNLVIGVVTIAVLAVVAYYILYPRSFRGALSGMGLEGFADAKKNGIKTPAANGSKLTGSAEKDAAAANLKNAHIAKVEKFEDAKAEKKAAPAPTVGEKKEAFADYASFDGSDSLGTVPMAAAQKPQGCYPREQLNPMELLPSDVNSQWAQVNPTGAGDIQGKNFLSAGALIGVNTIGQSLRNANLQLRAEPPNPQTMNLSPWLNSTIEPDLSRRPLE